MSRSELYSRQTMLHLKKYKTVLVVGCGGIGNWVALDLALSGRVENLYLVDPDTVEESNLNRTMFEYTDIGLYKIDCIARQIMLRRPAQKVFLMRKLLNDTLVENFIKKEIVDNSYYHADVCIVDCRDDVYDDCYVANCKLYKVGYDGMDVSIDGNPRLTKVFGQRGGSYTVTPSYVGSSQLAALLVVNDMLYPKTERMLDKNQISRDDVLNITQISELETFPYIHSRPGFEYDEIGRLNDTVSLNCSDIIHKFVENPHEYVVPNDDFSNLPNGGVEDEETDKKQEETKEETES